MNVTKNDLDLALERLNATANRSLQIQNDLDTVSIGVAGLRAEIARLERELESHRSAATSRKEYREEEVLIPIDPAAPIITVLGDAHFGTTPEPQPEWAGGGGESGGAGASGSWDSSSSDCSSSSDSGGGDCGGGGGD